MKSIAQFIKLFSDETRLRCITLILQNKNICVCELTHALELSQPKISRHLSTLRNSGLISDKRIGKWVYYSINSDLESEKLQLLKNIYSVLKGSKQAQLDQNKLKSMKNRPNELNCC